jgi:hypothetical protein
MHTTFHSPAFRIAQVDGTMIMETPDETQQISVDSQGRPVYAGTGYWLYGLTFVGLLIVSIVLYKASKRTQKQQ